MISGIARRRDWPDDFEAQLVAESLEDGAVISDVARRHGVVASWPMMPACAGNRKNEFLRSSPVAVQPRVCGEQLKIPVDRDDVGGSAPRVRAVSWPQR